MGTAILTPGKSKGRRFDTGVGDTCWMRTFLLSYLLQTTSIEESSVNPLLLRRRRRRSLLLVKVKHFDDSPVVELFAVATEAVELAEFLTDGCSPSSSRGFSDIPRVPPPPSRSDGTGIRSSIFGNAILLLLLLFLLLRFLLVGIATGDCRDEISKRKCWPRWRCCGDEIVLSPPSSPPGVPDKSETSVKQVALP